MEPALCVGVQSCANRKCPFPNCSHKVGRMKLSELSLCAEAWRLPLTGTQGPSPAPESNPPPSRLTLHLAHCSQKSCCPGNGQTPTERRDMSPRSVSTALKSSGGVLYINKRGALHCTCWCKARRELVAMETHSIKRCPCANPKPTQSPSHGTTPSSLSSWERLVLSSRFAGFDLLHLWSWKWLGHLDSVIWMAEWIPVATYTWFKVQEHLKCCSFTGLQHPSVSAATATK